MRRTTDEMALLLKKHNITVPTSARKADHREKTEEHEETCHQPYAQASKDQRLKVPTGTSKSPRYEYDLRHSQKVAKGYPNHNRVCFLIINSCVRGSS